MKNWTWKTELKLQADSAKRATTAIMITYGSSSHSSLKKIQQASQYTKECWDSFSTKPTTRTRLRRCSEAKTMKNMKLPC